MHKLTKSEDDYYNQLDDDFVGSKNEVQTALFEYLKYFEIGPETIMVTENGLPKVSWNGAKDEELAKGYIIRLGELLAYSRGVVHENSHGKWTGLGFEIVCSCKCDHKKTALALTEVEGPAANAYESIRQPSTREVTQENDY